MSQDWGTSIWFGQYLPIAMKRLGRLKDEYDSKLITEVIHGSTALVNFFILCKTVDGGS